MSLHILADHIAAQGRGNDSVLIHMTPREVSGLQVLAKAHGGSLTVNPKTGLPEAGFLDNLLPSLIGFGVGAMTGMPWLGAVAAGGTSLAQGKGLMGAALSGLGAYGMSGLGEAVGGAGQEAANAALGSEVAQGAEAARAAAQAQATSALPAEAVADPYAELSSEAIKSGDQAAADYVTNYKYPQLSKFDAMQAGLKAPGLMQKLWKDNKADMAMAGAGLLGGGLGSMASGVPQGQRPYETASSYAPGRTTQRQLAPVSYGLTPYEKNYFKNNSLYGATMAGGGSVESFNFPAIHANGGGVVPDNFDFQAKEHNYGDPVEGFAEGGAPTTYTRENSGFFDEQPQQARNYQPFSLYGDQGFQYTPPAGVASLPTVQPPPTPAPTTSAAGTTDTSGVDAWARLGYPNYAYWASMGGPPDTYFVPDYSGTYTSTMAAGGGVGRLLHGPGDGTSDSIPAQIEGGQPAALADGEFVVPARTVSELGNGSTKAGARKLEDMIKRVEKVRRTAKRGKDSNAAQHLPA